MSVITRVPADGSGAGLGATSVEHQFGDVLRDLLGADELPSDVATARDWASKKRGVCALAENLTRRLNDVVDVSLHIAEKGCEVALEGVVHVRTSPALERVSLHFLDEIVPRMERLLAVGFDTKRIAFELDLP